MKYLDEYRDRAAARRLADLIAAACTRTGEGEGPANKWTLMEVCGGQTHSIVRYGLDALLPPGVELLHGPGCPVCVTPLELIDRAQAVARQPGVVFCTFGDMLRVPGSLTDLFAVKAEGHDVRIVTSPLDAVRLAAEMPGRQVVFFAIGFETTAPANAMAFKVAKARGLTNFSGLLAHVRVPPSIAHILQSPQNRVQAFLGPGHVCSVMGTAEYRALASRYQVPIVVTGFEPVDLLAGVLTAVRCLEAGESGVLNAYGRVVRDEGNPAAQAVVDEVFAVCDRKWRGLGVLPKSGLKLSAAYRDFDAERRFSLSDAEVPEPVACLSGQVLKGMIKPAECPAFGGACTPETPLGATMVSSEGACAAYYHYRRPLTVVSAPTAVLVGGRTLEARTKSGAAHG